MTTAKVNLVSRALCKLGITSNINAPPEPEDLCDGMQQLESMMHEWRIKGFELGYAFEDEPDANTDSLLPVWAEEAVVANLAIKLAPCYGKEPHRRLETDAKSSYECLLNATLDVPCLPRSSTMPRGQGYQPISYRRFYQGEENVEVKNFQDKEAESNP
jgi:hypothetical protein